MSSPPVARKGIRRGGEQYEAIHEALAASALQALATDGYDGVTHAAVAESAGVSERTAFRHYPTKVELAVAGIKQLPTYDGWLEGPGSCADRFRRGLAIGAQHPELIVPVIAACIAQRNLEPELLHAVREHVLVPRRESMRTFVEEGRRTGELRETLTAEAMAALDLGLFFQSAAGMFPLGRGRARVDRLFGEAWPLLAAPGHEDD